MIINIPFQRKEADVEPEQCTVEKTIELSDYEFQHFKTHLLEDYDFIMKNRDEMGYTEDGVRHCLLVLSENGDDGILVDAQGANYARYSAYLPNARQMMLLGQYQSLSDFAKQMTDVAKDAVNKVLENQTDGTFYLKADDLPNPISNPLFDYKLLGEMLSERPEFSTVDVMSDEMMITIAPEYITENMDTSKYRELTDDEVDIMLAKHMLFLRDAGGERADFSGCLIRNARLSHAVFNNAILTNAAFIDCDLSEADMTFASAHGAVFKNCDISHMYGDEANFTYARFVGCDLHQALTMHANYTGATFDHCNVERMLLEGCCLARTDWVETDDNVADKYRAVYSVDEYDSEVTDDMKME